MNQNWGQLKDRGDFQILLLLLEMGVRKWSFHILWQEKMNIGRKYYFANSTRRNGHERRFLPSLQILTISVTKDVYNASCMQIRVRL